MSDRRRHPATFSPAGVYLPPPDGVTKEPEFVDGVYVPSETGFLASPMIGPSILGEYLMVDVRTAKAVPPGTRLYEVCQALGERGVCGVVERTLLVDLMEVSAEDRPLLLDMGNWPTDGGGKVLIDGGKV